MTSPLVTKLLRAAARDSRFAAVSDAEKSAFQSPGGVGIATQAEAEAGTDNVKVMTALRVAQAIVAQVGDSLTGAEIVAAIDTYLGSTTWQQGGGGGGSTTVVNDLTTGGTTSALSAQQGVVLKGQVDAKAPLASPALTGTPTAPTATAGTNTTQVATTAFVASAVAALVAASPAALDTLNELATALGNDANFATTMTNALAAKAPLASPTFTGTPSAPTATAGTNTTQVATTAFVAAALAAKANVANPSFTGIVTAANMTVDGITTLTGAMSMTATAMAANAIDVSKIDNTKSVNADTTFTFSSAPSAGYSFGMTLVNSGAVSRVITIPSSYSIGRQSAITSFRLPPNGRLKLQWWSDGANHYLSGDPGIQNNIGAASDPTVNDDAADGYERGSLWITTAGKIWFLNSPTAGAATWVDTTASGGGGGTTLTDSASLAAALSDETGFAAGALAVFSKNPLIESIRSLLSTPAATNTYTGQGYVGPNAAAGGITQWQAVYITASNTTAVADANGSGTFPCVGLALAAAAAGAPVSILDNGIARNDSWTWTAGAKVYLSGTAGALTQTAPATAGDNVQCIGYAISATAIRVNIGSGEYLTRS